MATVGTFVVIAASAWAALVQLRHLRRGYQITLLNGYNAEIASQDFRAAYQFVNQEFSPDALSADEIRALSEGNFGGRFAPLRYVANLFEGMGACVAAGSLDKEIICNLYSVNLLNAWEAVSPVVTLIREVNNRPQVWENFEYLAGLSQEYIERNPEGAVPKNARRMPRDESLIARYNPEFTPR